MATYIPKETALKVVEKYGTTNGFALGRHTGLAICIASEIAEIPAADVAPVVHGHWVEKELFIPWCDDDVDIIYECSCCRTESGGTSPYCPNCGAKMDGGADNG